jgi:hypothetical protein
VLDKLLSNNDPKDHEDFDKQLFEKVKQKYKQSC